MVVSFVLCWSPFHAQRLLAIYGSSSPSKVILQIYQILLYISGVTYYLSATINPILYHIMSGKFRQAFKDTFMKCCKNRRSRASISSCTMTTQVHHDATNDKKLERQCRKLLASSSNGHKKSVTKMEEMKWFLSAQLCLVGCFSTDWDRKIWIETAFFNSSRVIEVFF